MNWRVGKQVPINVYEAGTDRSICQCHDAADAMRMVIAVNELPAYQRGYQILEKRNEDLYSENERLRASVLNQQADNLCWATNPAQMKVLKESEMMESCRRYWQQCRAEHQLADGGMTIAQLESELLKAQLRIKELESRNA